MAKSSLSLLKSQKEMVDFYHDLAKESDLDDIDLDHIFNYDFTPIQSLSNKKNSYES